MNIGRKGNSFLKVESYLVSVIILTKRGGGSFNDYLFFLIIKPESFDAKAQKSVFPVKKNIYFHNRVKVNTLIQTL